MFELNEAVTVKWLAEKLNLSFSVKSEEKITNISSFSQMRPGSLSFFNKKAKNLSQGILISNEHCQDSNTIYSVKPRFDFVRALSILDTLIGFKDSKVESCVHPSVKIGKNVIIEDGVSIGEGSIIEHNAVIFKGTKIGKNCLIRSNSSIGGEGFGYERDENYNPVKFKHFGGVLIGNNVDVGSNTCIARGTLGDTVVESNVKIDNLVHIAHNCIIKKGAFIIACSELCGGVVVGENVWLAPNATVKEKVIIGDYSIVGLGAVVTKNIDAKKIVVGNPARVLRSV